MFTNDAALMCRVVARVRLHLICPPRSPSRHHTYIPAPIPSVKLLDQSPWHKWRMDGQNLKKQFLNLIVNIFIDFYAVELLMSNSTEFLSNLSTEAHHCARLAFPRSDLNNDAGGEPETKRTHSHPANSGKPPLHPRTQLSTELSTRDDLRLGLAQLCIHVIQLFIS